MSRRSRTIRRLVGLHAARNNSLRKITGLFLERLDAPVSVRRRSCRRRCHLGADLLRRHHRQHAGAVIGSTTAHAGWFCSRAGRSQP